MKILNECKVMMELAIDNLERSGRDTSIFVSFVDRLTTEINAQKQIKPSLPLFFIDEVALEVCIDLYKEGEKITAIKWLIEEAKKCPSSLNIKWANEFLEKQ